MTLLEVVGVSKRFRSLSRGPRGVVAVDDVSLSLRAGQILAIVGESGSGKSTLARLILRLVEADTGSITLLGEDIRAMRPRRLRKQRARMQMIFQDPFRALDPRMTVGQAVDESLQLHTELRRRERHGRVLELLNRVGLRESHFARYPYQMSGGQLQRVAVARALACDPVLLVCDEPTASLDVSIRGQILQLLSELPQSGRVGVLFISHDLRVVKDFADNVAVMSNGRIVEHGTIAEVYAAPKAPYTRGLLSAIPSLDPRHRIILSDRAALANKGPWSGTGSTTQQGDSLI